MRWKTNLKELWAAYFQKLWIPPLFVACAFTLQFLGDIAYSKIFRGGVYFLYLYRIVTDAASFIVYVSFVGLLAAITVHLFKRRWWEGSVVLLIFILGVLPTYVMFTFVMIAYGLPADNFGRDIVVPAGMKMEEPLKEVHSVFADGSWVRSERDVSKWPENIEKGKTDIYLVSDHQGGIYNVYAQVNPGEPGRVYLKVFEATRNTPLSESRIKPDSEKRMEWSGNKEERVDYISHIKVYEGDFGVYYPGRFELWFIPDSGGPERKLVEKIFKIEGWQR